MDYNNFDDLLKLTHKFLFNKEECFNYKTINKDNIILEDIKTENFDLEILNNYQLQHKREFNTSISFETEKFMIFITPYEIEQHNDIKKQPLLNTLMLYVLSSLYIESYGNVLFPLRCFDVKYNKLKKYIQNLPKKNEFNILIVEKFNPVMTFDEYLSRENVKKPEEIKMILLQILYTIYKINDEHKFFTHNNLIPSAVYLYFLKEPIIMEYKIIGEEIKFKTNIIVKIGHFDDAILYGLNTNTIEENKKHIDIEKLFNEILKHDIGKEIKEELKELLSMDFHNLEPLNIILKNNFFSLFIKKMSSIPSKKKTKGGKLILGDHITGSRHIPNENAKSETDTPVSKIKEKKSKHKDESSDSVSSPAPPQPPRQFQQTPSMEGQMGALPAPPTLPGIPKSYSGFIPPSMEHIVNPNVNQMMNMVKNIPQSNVMMGSSMGQMQFPSEGVKPDVPSIQLPPNLTFPQNPSPDGKMPQLAQQGGCEEKKPMMGGQAKEYQSYYEKFFF